MANLRVDKITSTETFEKTGSVQFDGNGDYLRSTTNLSDYQFGTGDFTVEAWIYKSVNGSNNYDGLCTYGTNGSGDDGWFFEVSATRGYVFWIRSVEQISFNETPNTSQWIHTAVTRKSGVIRLFVNGVLKQERNSSTEVKTTGTSFDIGAYAIGNDNFYFNGHISNLRIIKGTALYIENFKPPMRELEVVPGTVLLACQSKTDASLEKTGKTITVNGTAVASELTPGILTPIVKSGGGSAITGSVEFTSSTDALVLSAGEDFAYGTGDFTIEAWIQPQGINGGETKGIFTQTQSGNDYIVFKVDSDKAIKATFGSTTVSGGTVEVGSWHHVAVTRASNTVKIFVNGIASAGTTVSTDFSDTTRNPTIGQYTHTYGSIEYYGFISNFRINKGTALYTDDFIPPTRELKNVPGTVLLCCQDSNDPTQEVTGKTITGYGDLRRTDGSELVTNGDFSNGTTGWTISDAGEGSMAVVSGQLVVTNDDTNDPPVYAWQQITTVAGNRYRVKFQLVGGTASSTAIYLNSASSFGDAYGQRATSGDNALAVGALGELEFVAAGTSAYILLRVNANAAATSIFDNISAYAIPHDADAPASNFTPQVGDDRQITFEGVTKINTDAYFYLPTGDTASREATGSYSAGTRGLFAGGYDQPALKDTIDYITISSTGNALDFGNLTDARILPGALASSVRGIIGGGTDPSASNIIDYVTIPSTGNATDFGDLTVARRAMASFSNDVRGIWAGGDNPSRQTTIDYVTISSTGNAAAFGTLGEATNTLHGTSSSTRGLLMGGETGSVSPHNAISYVTISTTGSNKDFGDLTQARRGCSSCSSPIRALTGGGNTGSVTNTIDFVTIATTGNAFDFGNLTQARWLTAATSNSIRGVWGGGYNPSPAAEYDIIDYITIASTGNATDFGNLQTSKRSPGACSNGHGGLG